MKTYKVLGLLLTYPVSEMQANWTSIGEILEKEQLLSKKALTAIKEWIANRVSADIYRLQEEYVDTFDRSRSHCLHLFEHVHGESRDRGQAMVNLVDMYAAKGLVINHAELPDYLPLFLEYCSRCDYKEAQSLLEEIGHILVSIGARLKQRKNDYYVVFETLQDLSKTKVSKKIIDAAIAYVAAEDESLEALDKRWEEAPAFDNNPKQDACNTCQVTNPAGISQEQVIKVSGGTI